jgi:hypothetical protein
VTLASRYDERAHRD